MIAENFLKKKKCWSRAIDVNTKVVNHEFSSALLTLALQEFSSAKKWRCIYVMKNESRSTYF